MPKRKMKRCVCAGEGQSIRFSSPRCTTTTPISIERRTFNACTCIILISISIDLDWDEDDFLQRLEAPLWDENDSEDLASMYEQINEKYIVAQRPEDTLMLETPSNLLDGTPGMSCAMSHTLCFCLDLRQL